MLSFEKSFINKYDCLLPITDSDAGKFQSWGNAKPMLTAPFGINSNDYKPKYNTKSPIKLFYLGALDWEPNISGLIWFLEKVWPNIKSDNIELNIAGRNASEKIKNYLNSITGITFHGEIESAKNYICENDIMIVPLFSGSGMRVKIIEGMAMGKAIISTPLGAQGISAENGKEIALATDSESFEESIKLLIRDKNKLNKMGENARKLVVEKFDNYAICSNILSIYMNLLNK